MALDTAVGYFCRTAETLTDEIVKEYIENQQDESKETFKIEE